MRTPVVDMDVPLARRCAGRKTRRLAGLERVHWLRLGGLGLMLGLWPAIIVAVGQIA